MEKFLRRWCVILNPRAGANRALRRRAELEKLLNESKSHYEIIATTRSGEAQEIARWAAREGFTGIAAAGGDGTLGDVLNGLIESEKDIPLAILPLGTGNDFARTLGVLNLRDAVSTMSGDNAQRVDVGAVSTESHRRFFINIAGCGFDAVVARRINEGKFGRGTFAYICATLQTLRDFRAAKVRLNLDAEIVETRALLCAVANAQSYGGGMKIAPRAVLDDGFFDVCLIGDATRMEFLRAFPSVFKGAHEDHPKVRVARAKSVRIESEIPLPVLADGELVGETPVEFKILPRAATVMFPVSSSAAAKTERRN